MLVKTFLAAVPALAIQPEMLSHLARARTLPRMLSAALLKLLELGRARGAWLPIEPVRTCCVEPTCCFPAQLDLLLLPRK